MIRDRFYCPNCQMEEVPVLVKTPWYNCPDCQTISPRAEMLTKRTAKLALAGTNSFNTPELTLVATGSLIDIGQTTSQLSSSAFTSRANDRLLVVVNQFAATAVPTSVFSTVSSSFTSIGSAGVAGGIMTSMWFSVVGDFTQETPGDSIVATWGVAFPASAVMSVYRISNVGSTGLDRTATAANPGSTSISAGPTSALTAAGELCVAAVTRTGNAAQNIAWGNGFTSIRNSLGTASTQGFDIGILRTDSKAAITAIATTESTEWAAVLATFKKT